MDRRDVAAFAGEWYERFDQRRMVVTVELYNEEKDEYEVVEVPVRFDVCGTCGGRGRHTNPSIDRDGLTAEDFEDMEFEEDYRNGHYDVTCGECEGERVVPVLDEERCPRAILEQVREKIRDDWAYARERVHEIEMGY